MSDLSRSSLHSAPTPLSLSPEPCSNGTSSADNHTAPSYAQIFRSSTIIGAAQIIKMAIGLVRTKFAALLIGPTGIGLISLYESILEFATSVSGLGIQSSGVRDVAKFHAQGDQVAIARTVITLRRLCWLTGIAGMLLLALLAPWISRWTMGTTEHATAIALLGVIIVLTNITLAQSSVMRGLRRIADLAMTRIFGALFGTIAAILCYWSLGPGGIPAALILVASAGLAVSAFYARKVTLASVAVTWKESLIAAGGMMSFGLAVAWSGFMTTLVGWITRGIVIRSEGLEQLGIYSAAAMVSAVFIQFILNTMGTDFFPSIVAVSHSRPRMTRLINEQTEIGIVMAFPGLLATLLFSPWLIRFLYSSDFAAASGLLNWFVVGCFAKLISWPLRFSLLAKGQSRLFVLAETSYNLVHLLLFALGLRTFGLHGVAYAFAASYGIYLAGVFLLSRLHIGFAWDRSVLRLVGLCVILGGTVFAVATHFSATISLLVGIPILIFSCWMSLRHLIIRLGKDHAWVRKISQMPGGKWLTR